jgi:hypothetical protein
MLYQNYISKKQLGPTLPTSFWINRGKPDPYVMNFSLLKTEDTAINMMIPDIVLSRKNTCPIPWNIPFNTSTLAEKKLIFLANL